MGAPAESDRLKGLERGLEDVVGLDALFVIAHPEQRRLDPGTAILIVGGWIVSGVVAGLTQEASKDLRKAGAALYRRLSTAIFRLRGGERDVPEVAPEAARRTLKELDEILMRRPPGPVPELVRQQVLQELVEAGLPQAKADELVRQVVTLIETYPRGP